MDIEKLILETLRKKNNIKAADIIKETSFSRTYINRFFQKLRDEGRIILVGKANKATYILATKQAVDYIRGETLAITKILQNKNLSEDSVLDDIKKKTSIFVQIPKNVSSILDYSFLEMFNNAIEHSKSKMIKTRMQKDKDRILFDVTDKGVGIFNNIMKKKNLKNKMEAIQDLLKGKQTTAPKEHTGEGIFFTSKAADMFIIQSSNKKLIFNNLLDDIFIKNIKSFTGTKVIFSISLNSKRHLDDIFKKYTDSSFKFSKTQVTVRLYRMSSQYISRSQARRIVGGLDKFKTIVLDFKDVEMVGQGFADEIFRVWQSQHLNTSIIIQNANENVEFMINRAKSTYSS